MSYVIIALWGAVIAGAVLGRIIDPPEPPEAEVYESNADIVREQMRIWSQEFFGKSKSTYHLASRTEILEEFPRFQNQNYNQVHSSRSMKQDDVDRLNTRHYDVASVAFTSNLKVKVKPENLEWMLQNIFMYPRNHNTNETAKELAKKYIVDSLQLTSGISTSVQHFQPIQFLNIYDGYSLPMGSNLIGIIKGQEWGTPNDRPVLVGAHWDTVSFTPGTDDNGSGVAAMLETARTISHSGCRPKYSIIFVAFDLEEVGSQGSLVFIKEFLMDILKSNFPKEMGLARFQGAFIMDTIMDFNETEGSQTFPRDWSLVLPEVYDQVADSRYKGDFLSMIYRRDVDNRMADKFRYHWHKSSHDSKFKLTSFPLGLGKQLPGLNILADHLNFLRSDHSRFWYMNDTAVPETLSAVLMTDTGPYRGNMRNCYHTVCDGPEVSVYNNAANLQFLTKITQVLTDTLIDMSECQHEESRTDLEDASQNYIKTTQVHAKSASYRNGSPLRNLMNFVRWMELTSSK